VLVELPARKTEWKAQCAPLFRKVSRGMSCIAAIYHVSTVVEKLLSKQNKEEKQSGKERIMIRANESCASRVKNELFLLYLLY
jgi:hypothetical protein